MTAGALAEPCPPRPAGDRTEMEEAARSPPATLGEKLGEKFGWRRPAEPFQIVGPLYFVGTKGLGAFLFSTSEGLVLLNTGLPSSAPQIEDSICALGFRPQDLVLIIGSHAHIDHVGAVAELGRRTGASVAMLRAEVLAMENGDRDDFRYGAALAFPKVTVDRVLDDKETIRKGDVILTAHATPGHTRGSTTWVAQIPDGGRTWTVVFPDGTGINPGYRLVTRPSYPGIADDYRRTFARLEGLTPDIWLAPHNDVTDLAAKRMRARSVGPAAWVDPDGYRAFVAKARAKFEKQVADETAAAAR